MSYYKYFLYFLAAFLLGYYINYILSIDPNSGLGSVIMMVSIAIPILILYFQEEENLESNAEIKAYLLKVFGGIGGAIAFLFVLKGFRSFDLGLGFAFGATATVTFAIYSITKAFSRRDHERKRHESGGLAQKKDYQEFSRLDGGIFMGGGYAYQGEGNHIILAPSGSGKGTCLIVPNLLGKSNYEGSWIVIDPKGQNAFLSAKYQHDTGRKVICLNPWQLYTDKLGPTDTYNPLDILSKDNPELWDDCRIIAETIIPISSSKDPFWENSARNFLTLALAHMITTDQGKTLGELSKMISPAEGDLTALLDEMTKNTHPDFGDNIQESARRLQKGNAEGSNTFSSQIQTLYEAVEKVASPVIRKNTMKSSFSLVDIVEKKVALYIIIPPRYMDSGSKWLRLVITTLARAILAQNGAKHRVTFLMDEFATLGYMGEIVTALTLYRGYNMSMLPVMQSVEQLKMIYPKAWKIFLDNAAVQYYMNVNDIETAERLSKLAGTHSHFTYSQSGNTWTPTGSTAKKNLTMHDIMSLSADNIIVVVRNKPLMIIPKVKYFNDTDLIGRYPDDIPPELR